MRLSTTTATATWARLKSARVNETVPRNSRGSLLPSNATAAATGAAYKIATASSSGKLRLKLSSTSVGTGNRSTIAIAAIHRSSSQSLNWAWLLISEAMMKHRIGA